MLLRCKTQSILSHAFINFKEFDTLILESFKQFSDTFVPLDWLYYDAIFPANKKIQYNNYYKKEVWLPKNFGSYFMMFSLHISIVSKSQNHETYAYSKYQPYILEFHTVATKSTILRDVFQLSSHILCKAYIDFQQALLEGCQTASILGKIPENDNAIIEQMYLEKKETGKTQSNNLHKSSRWIRHISSSDIAALTC